MKKIFLVLFVILLAAVCFAASAEEAQIPRMTCSTEDGQLIIRIIRKADDPGTWEADEPEGDDIVVTLLSSDITDSLATFVYAPVKDGWQVVEVWHIVEPVCDEFYRITVEVEDGAIIGAEDGEHIISPEDALLDPFLIGEWLEVGDQFHTLTVTDNDTSGWDLTVISPLTHGAYKFVGTVLFDCDEDALVYTNGTVYNLPVTDGEDASPDTPAIMENLMGLMICEITDVEDGELVLYWMDPVTSEVVCFNRSDENAPDIIAPEIVGLDLEDGLLPDGVYWAYIDPDALRSGSLENAVFCAVDVYSGVDIRQINPGEMLFREYSMYWIDSVAEEGTIEYRDASDEITGTINFVSIPGSDDYVAMDAESNSPMLTALDIVEMPLDDAAKMIVFTGESLEETTVDNAGMADIIASEADMTLVVIRNGRVQEIRHYRDISVAGMMADVRSDGSDQ